MKVKLHNVIVDTLVTNEDFLKQIFCKISLCAG
jgi:hypothetical protein